MTETCLLCGESMADLKHDLTEISTYSDRPVYTMFETCIGLKLPPDVIESAGVCQNCFLKFSEIDEHQTIADNIQNDLVQLYNNSLSMEMSCEVKQELYEEEHLIEVDMTDNHQTTDETPRKSRSYKSDKDQPYTVLEIDNKKCYQCHICLKIINRRPKEHIAIHSIERNFKCLECGALFRRSKDLARHRTIHSERKYRECDLCEMKYTTKNQLKKHIDAIHLKTKNFICPICGKCFSRDNSLTSHMHVHQPRVRNIDCTICSFKTYTKEKLKRHMLSHTGERNYSCNICGKQFLYSYNVTQHINYVHKGIRYKVDEAKLTCHVCGLKFPKQHRVRSHLREVHGIDEEGESLKDDSMIVTEWIEETIE